MQATHTSRFIAHDFDAHHEAIPDRHRAGTPRRPSIDRTMCTPRPPTSRLSALRSSIGRGYRKRIEGLAVILHRDSQRIRSLSYSGQSRCRARSGRRLGMEHDVRDDLVERKVHLEDEIGESAWASPKASMSLLTRASSDRLFRMPRLQRPGHVVNM